MSNLSKFACFALSAALLLNGCKGKDGDPGPAGATGAAGTSGQSLTGTVYGFVNSTDENGASVSKAGVSVALEGATTQTATTDANGRFEFLNVRNGTYNLTYTRANYATVKRFAVSHVGGDQPTFLGLTTVTQVSNTTITNLTQTGPSTTSGIPLSFNVVNSNTANSTYRASFFASNTAGVTSANGTLLTTYILNASGPTSILFSRTTLLNAGFAAGTTVYLVAYGSPVSLASYVDPTTGRFVYTSLNPTPSNAISFVL
ncbi:carboxypeptidase-like regulatory domain-containing protein [Hymenobacter ruber]